MPVKRSKLVTRLTRIPVIGDRLRKRHDAWLSLKYHLYQEYLLNPYSSHLYGEQKISLTESQQRVVQELNRDGIATINFDELFADKEYWDRFCEYVQKFAESDVVVERTKSFALNPEPENLKDHKYIVRHFAEDQTIAWDNPMLQISINSRILDIVNSYLGLWAKLKKIHLWYTVPLDTDRTRSGSQNWHRDPEDRKMVTVFLYLTDVDEMAGPLQYIPSTRYGGQYQSLWPVFGGASNASSTTEEEVAERIPPSEQRTITCSRGTFVFCDTSGFHRGGYAIKRPRIVAHWTYASPASLWPRRFKLDRSLNDCTACDAAKFALK